MFSSSQRSEGIEIMDDLDCRGEVVNQTLRELDFINQWLGGNQVTLQPLRRIISTLPSDKTITIADLGCGSGEMLKLIAREFRNHKLNLIGIDANPNIIEFAKLHTAEVPAISVKTVNVFDPAFENESFDIVIATLFMHHFSESELARVLKTLKRNTRTAIIINDLHRHPLAYRSIKILTSLFSRSAMVRFDAPLSVARGFKKEEWIGILKEAGFKNYSLIWKWAFRWQLIIDTNHHIET
jgi:Methylase involved in ubiquinone/menaquinone biosynthesis